MFKNIPPPRFLKSFAKLGVFIALAFLVNPSIIFSQATTATLTGVVVDSNGAVVPNVTITVLNPATALERTVTTNDDGYYSVPLLPAATYSITARREGFAPVEIKDLVLNVGDQRALRIELRIGQVTEAVEVTSEGSLVDVNPSVGTTIDRAFVNNLPMNGRSIQTLIALSPGVVAVPVAGNGGSQGQFSVNGQRANSNHFTVDGVSGNFSIPVFESFGQNASGSIPSTTIQGGFQNLASVDALQEFTIQTSTFAAEFGRGPGAQVSLVTRPGENQYHGSLFEYFRNDVFDARDFFDPVKPPLRFNNFGGTFSGPVILPRFGEGVPALWKGTDKTYFFFSYEGQRFVLPQPAVTTTVPSLTARTTNILANTNPPTPANEVARAILNAYPLPNGPDIFVACNPGPSDPLCSPQTRTKPTGGALYTTVFSNPQSSDVWSVRIDHNLTKNFTLFGRLNYSPSQSLSRSTSTTSNPSSFSVFKQPTQKLYFGSTQVFGSKVVNEIRADFSRQEGFWENGFDGLGGGVLPPTSIFLPEGLGTQRRYSFFPITNVFGTYTYGDVSENENRQFQLVDNLSYRLGSHQLKFGGDYRRLTPTIGANDLILSVQPVTLQNVYDNRLQSITAFKSIRYTALFETFYFYGQDTWKAGDRLTLTYGLGWNINPSPTGTGDKIPYTLAAPPDLSQLNQSSLALAPLGTPYYETEYTNFSPRFGFAWQVSQKPGRELVARGGIGVFYDLGQVGFGNAGFPYSNNVTISGAPPNPPIPLPVPASLIAIPDRSLTLSRTNRASVTAAAEDYTLPRTYQWNLTAEQSLGKDQAISVGYVGALGRKLVRVRRIDISLQSLTNPGTPQVPGAYFSDQFSGVTLIDNGAESEYHSLQAQFTRRLSRGLQAIASYTWSHSIDNASSDQAFTSPGYIFPQDDFRGDSDFDVRHNFSGAVTYNLPTPKGNRFASAVLGGWSINSVFSARTGLAYNVQINELTPINAVGAFRRPDLTGQPFYIDDANVATGRRLNPAAFNFVLPAGRMGNHGRNSLRGPGFWQVDLGIHRTFGLFERLKMQLRWEVFNVFNHPTFLYPTTLTATYVNGVLSIPATFGIINRSAARSFNGGGNTGGFNPLFQNGGPRSMQFAARFNF
jgi:hypothetical protein